MNKILTIVKKELKRYFTDKRTLLSLFLPGILIFTIYYIMGGVIQDKINVSDDTTFNVYATTIPDEYKNMYSNLKINYIKDELSEEEILTKVTNKEIDLYVKFEDNFQEKVTNGEKPAVELYYNSTNLNSQEIEGYTEGYLNQFALSINYNFIINGDQNKHYNLASDSDQSKMLIQMMLPFLLIIFLFSGCMAISAEAIAGEKERGTIYTLLVTPTKRSVIAIGKILALSIVSLVSATVSFLGTSLSLPRLMGGDGFDLSIYSPGTYILIFLTILVAVIFFTSLLLLLSSYAKSVKESSQLAVVIMIPTMLAGVTSMLNTSSSFYTSFIPIYNSIKAMSNVFSGEIDYLSFALTIGMNIIYISVFIVLLTKMFNSEKIMRTN